MKIESLYQLYLNSGTITIDSRLSTKGALFFALKGDSDGNKYAKMAIENGCAYAIIDNPQFNIGDNYILVDNVLITLQSLAKYHRQQFNIPIIAITGTNGKTTTKELIASVLNKKYIVSYTQGNLNNHIGVPLTILSFKKNTEIGVIEMGANHINDIKELCEIAIPNYGIITNIGKAHLEGFGSFENVINTKKELYDYLKLTNGKVFYNSGNQILREIISALDINSLDFGNESSIVNGTILNSSKFLSFNITIGNFVSDINTKLIGNYNFENVLAAALIGNYFNIDAELIKDAIENYTPKNNRSQYIATNKNNIILDAYNANPTSVNAAITNFHSLNLENTCLILGDMLELGEASMEEHQAILKLILNYKFENVFLIGDIYSSFKVPSSFLQFNTVEKLKQWFLKAPIKNSNILIKGSRGIRLEQIIDYL